MAIGARYVHSCDMQTECGARAGVHLPNYSQRVCDVTDQLTERADLSAAARGADAGYKHAASVNSLVSSGLGRCGAVEGSITDDYRGCTDGPRLQQPALGGQPARRPALARPSTLNHRCTGR